ncbi:hypothetical protein L6452_35739 [Arctium lappa]|uniref:Uncharacterized protein n=1 Tax=Arctium lappa TaxID=4217 RepID=A0ACB8Y7D1_ARCLA|nr:hypothetical protein L6452_35739 [Arctium lappa]
MKWRLKASLHRFSARNQDPWTKGSTYHHRHGHVTGFSFSIFKGEKREGTTSQKEISEQPGWAEDTR